MEQYMRKTTILFFIFLIMAHGWAGDVATFVNLGFSADGKQFVFGQYGVTDKDYQAYADIFAVDVAKNSFIREGLFSRKPSSETAARDAKGVFASLQNTAAPAIQKLSVDSANQGRPLYIQAVDEPGLRTIAFRDFESSTDYSVETHVLVEGSGKDVKSSFYLSVSITGKDGKTAKKTVGLPGFKRDGVKGYLVRRVQIDQTGSSLVFVVEKEQVDRNGSSIRYMVETLRL